MLPYGHNCVNFSFQFYEWWSDTKTILCTKRWPCSHELLASCENITRKTCLHGVSRDTDAENRGVDVGWGGKRRWDGLGDWDWHIYTTMGQTDSEWEPPGELREFSSMFSGGLDGWDRGGVSEVHEGAGLCTYTLIHFAGEQKITWHCKATVAPVIKDRHHCAMDVTGWKAMSLPGSDVWHVWSESHTSQQKMLSATKARRNMPRSILITAWFLPGSQSHYRSCSICHSWYTSLHRSQPQPALCCSVHHMFQGTAELFQSHPKRQVLNYLQGSFIVVLWLVSVQISLFL